MTAADRPAADRPAADRPAADPALADDGFVETLPYRIVRPYRGRFEEAVPGDTVRTAIILGWAADVAWQHSALLGFDRDWYTRRGLFWLVRAARLDVLAPIAMNQPVQVSTQVVAYRRIAALRRTQIRDASGARLASLEIHWVMTNERGLPTRVPDEMRRFVADDATFEMLKVCLPDSPANPTTVPFRVHRRDLDPLDHVNNSVYVDYLEAAIAAAGGSESLSRTPRRYEIDFAAAAARDEELVGRAWEDDGAWLYSLRRPDGTELFRGRLTPSPVEE